MTYTQTVIGTGTYTAIGPDVKHIQYVYVYLKHPPLQEIIPENYSYDRRGFFSKLVIPLIVVNLRKMQSSPKPVDILRVFVTWAGERGNIIIRKTGLGGR